MTLRNCPACGAPVSFKTSICLLAVCAHCRSLVQRKDLDVAKLGESAQLMPDGTPLQLGARGSYKGRPFEIVGRVQLRTKKGFWNEWTLSYANGDGGWLGEAQGTYAVSWLLPDAKAPAKGALRLGAKVELDGRVYRVRELAEAEYAAAEGELPFRPPLGEKAPSADLVAPGGLFATIDWSEAKPLVFAGEYEEFDELAFTGLRAFEGWPAP